MTSVLQARQVRHSYGSTPALRGVDLTVEAGEVVALLGPNGAGKTTLVRALIGLVRPDGGSVLVAGGDPASADVRRRLGVVQQEVGFPRTLTVEEVVRGAAARAGRPESVATGVISEMGLAGLERRRAAALSGGQQQRLQLAMGLVTDPVALVLDEPTVGLDVASRRAFWGTLGDRRSAGAGILLTTHIVEEAGAVADRVVVLDRGAVVVSGTPEELRRSLPGRLVTAVTSVRPEVLRAVDGVVSAESAGDRVAITATEAEPVVRLLLEMDEHVRDLTVSSASLEEVLVAVTGEKEEVAA